MKKFIVRDNPFNPYKSPYPGDASQNSYTIDNGAGPCAVLFKHECTLEDANMLARVLNDREIEKANNPYFARPALDYNGWNVCYRDRNGAESIFMTCWPSLPNPEVTAKGIAREYNRMHESYHSV